MEDIIKNDGGQWIVLSGLVLSLVFIVIAILANQAVINGYYSSNAALELPKEDIRELTLQTRYNTKVASDMAYKHGANRSMVFKDTFDDCSMQMKALYAARGQAVDIRIIDDNKTSITGTEIIWLGIGFNDGRTKYVSDPEVVEVKRT